MAPETARKWMHNYLAAFGDRPIKDFCFPRSHDAGTYKWSYGAGFGSEATVLTQKKSIFEQLELGVRRFDIRPMYVNKFGEFQLNWHCGHYTNIGFGKGWQGGSCASITEVVQDLNRFTEHNPELIIIELTHVYKILITLVGPNYRESLAEEEMDKLFGILDGIKFKYDAGKVNLKDRAFQDVPLKDFIGGNQAAVLILLDDYDNNDKIYAHGCWPWYISRAPDRPYLDLPELPDELSMIAMQSDGEAVGSTFGVDKYSVLNLAQQKQDLRFPWVLQDVVSIGSKARRMPCTISLDGIADSDLLTLCLAITDYRLNGRAKDSTTTIVYGGKVVTDLVVRRAIQDAINQGKSFVVNNTSLGSDPWDGMVKSCAVLYSQGDIYEARWARENSHLHFEMDVFSLTYGNSSMLNQTRYTRFLKLVHAGIEIEINNDLFDQEDPLKGARKTMVINFRTENDSARREVRGEEYNKIRLR